MKTLFIAFFSLFASLLFAQETPKFSLSELLKIKKIEKTFTGNFDNKKQADTTKIKMLAHQQVRVLRVWKKEKPGQYWMYSGWFFAGDEQRPFQENMYQITAMRGDTMVMQAYNCPIELRQNGTLRDKEWAQPDAFAALTFEDLRPYCEFIIFPHKEGYRMESSPLQVPTNIEGSAFDKIEFIIERQGKQFNLMNTYFLRGTGQKITLPQGVLYEWKTSNPKAF